MPAALPQGADATRYPLAPPAALALTGAAVSPADRFASVAHAQTGSGGGGGEDGSRTTSATSTVGTYSLGSTLATTSLSSLAAGSVMGGVGARRDGDGEAGSADAVRFGIVGQGPTVAFNLLRADGSWVGYRCASELSRFCV